MKGKFKLMGIASIVVFAAMGFFLWGEHAAQAQESGQAGDNYPLGRKPAAIVDGQYPASYFPNTELLGPMK
jgi:hypothetical protein